MKRIQVVQKDIQFEVTQLNYQDNWFKGEYLGFPFEAKVYSKPSDFGINCGYVSKLYITTKKGKVILNYDRGWDIGEEELTNWIPVVARLDEIGGTLLADQFKEVA